MSLTRSVALAPLLVVALASKADASGPSKQQCVDANSAAQDLRRSGKLIEAREKLAMCVAASCPGPVREDCAERAKEVEAAIPSVVFEAQDGAGNDLAAVRVTIDGQSFADKLDGSAVTVDPGEHRFAFTAEGQPNAVQTIVVREGDKGRHVGVVLGALAARGASLATVAPAEGSSQRTWGLVLGGAGVAGIAVGSAFGLLAKSSYDSAHCPEACAAVPPDAWSKATASTVGFIAGGALLVGGAVLYLTTPSVAVGPTVGTSGVGLSMRGAW